MANFDFPSSPSNGQTYTANGITFSYNGTVWKRETGATKGIKGEPSTVAGDKGQKGEVGAGSDGAKGQKGETGATGGAGNSNSTQNIRRFTGNTTYSPTSGTKNITVYCVAGGGGSGRAQGDMSGEQNEQGASAGGGGGGACIGHYNLGSGFSASITVGGGGSGGPQYGQNGSGGTGGESRFTPSGQYSGSGTLDANGGGGSGNQSSGGGGGGSSSGGINLSGRSGGTRVGEVNPGEAGIPAYVFGTYGYGGRGVTTANQSSDQAAGSGGNAGVVIVYEYLV